MSKATKTKKTAEPIAASNGTTVEDISHEEVHDDQTEGEKAEVIDPEKQIKNEIAKFHLADAGIAQLKKDYGALVISGPDDKAGYKAVREAWQLVRSKRTGLEKKGLEIRNRFKIITSAVSKEEDRLVELLTPLEEDLHKKWKAIDDEKDRLKREAEEEEKRQLMARVEEVLALGMTFKDGFYVCGDTISMDVATLRALPVEQYDKLKKAVEAKSAELAKAEADAAAERQRQADELQRQKDDLKRQQDEMRQQQEEFQRQQKELQRQQQAARDMQYKTRLNELSQLGMIYSPQYDAMVFEDVNVDNKTEINLFNEEEWTALIAKITPAIDDRKKAKAEREAKDELERKAMDEKKKNIGELMGAAGFYFSYTAQAFTWENDIKAIEASLISLIPLTDDELNEKIRLLKAEKFAAEQTSRDNKDKREAAAEKERKAGLTDKKRWDEHMQSFEDEIRVLVPGEFKTAKYQKLAQVFVDSITEILNGVK